MAACSGPAECWQCDADKRDAAERDAAERNAADRDAAVGTGEATGS